MEGSYKAPKGLIKVKAEVKAGHLSEIQISGDFFMYPEDCLWNLEKSLLGTEVSKDKIRSRVEAFYSRENVLSPGVAPEDFTEAIIKTICVTEQT